MVWPQIEPMIVRALRHGQGDGSTPEYVYKALLEDETVLWVIHDDEDIRAMAVLSITLHPQGKKLNVELLAGEGIDDWGDELETLLMDFRDLLGAYCIEASCRRGLAKYLLRRPLWRQKAVIMEIPSNHEVH